MALELIGRVVQVLEMQSGTSAKGEWKKQEFILETEEQYPRKICISLWGDRVADIVGISLNKEIVTVSVALESREFNGRWYTDVRAWRIQRGGQASTPKDDLGGQAFSPAAPTVQQQADSTPIEKDDPFDDLPF
jgi:hypothetical protein